MSAASSSPSTRRSSTSATASASVTPSANATSSSAPFSVSQTFSAVPDPTPPALPTGGPPPPTRTAARSPLPSSIVLYTFLATLILLLGVSSAIVARSLLLRRRHRRMAEEAIANGTWVPPAPRVKVDLRKKPRLWDASLAPPMNVPVRGGGGEGEKDEWEAIMRPIPSRAHPTLLFSLLPRSLPASLPPRSLPSASPQSPVLAFPHPHIFIATSFLSASASPLPAFSSLHTHARSPPPHLPPSAFAFAFPSLTPPPQPFAASYTPPSPSHAPPPYTACLPSTSAASSPSPAHPPANANALNGKAADAQPELELEQPRVRVAVLIAMPMPPPTSSSQLSLPPPPTPRAPLTRLEHQRRSARRGRMLPQLESVAPPWSRWSPLSDSYTSRHRVEEPVRDIRLTAESASALTAAYERRGRSRVSARGGAARGASARRRVRGSAIWTASDLGVASPARQRVSDGRHHLGSKYVMLFSRGFLHKLTFN
ncbi:hypothetical protein DFH09DRAFT_1421955 [Mycena vulgaris]|nr:hypothetical protein DFH09DRAFT_1421955 [Mycena vulgaris]